MKRLIILSLALAALVSCIPCMALAQLTQSRVYMDDTRLDWKIDATRLTTDTLAVSSKKYTAPFSSFEGLVTIEGFAIFTGGTDSMKIVAYLSDDPYPQDTMAIHAVDSVKLLSATSISAGKMKAGNFHYRFYLNGEYGHYISLAFVPLNGVTGKITKIAISKE